MVRHQGKWSLGLPLCHGSGGSRSRDGSSLGAGFGGSSRSGHGRSGSGSRSRSVHSRLGSSSIGVGRAVTGNVTGLGTLVADLTRGAERAAIRSGAVSRDVAELAACVALHGLSLAVTGKVVGATTLVAGSSAGVTAKAAAEALEATAGGGGAASTGSSRVAAVALQILVNNGSFQDIYRPNSTYSKVTGLAAVVAAAIGTTVQAESGAVSLDMAKTLAVVALLRWGRRQQRGGMSESGSKGGSLLSVVRGRGQPLDSCPV